MSVSVSVSVLLGVEAGRGVELLLVVKLVMLVMLVLVVFCCMLTGEAYGWRLLRRRSIPIFSFSDDNAHSLHEFDL